jgi:hypothetical protein
MQPPLTAKISPCSGYHTRSPSYSATVWSLEVGVSSEKVMAATRIVGYFSIRKLDSLFGKIRKP